MTFHFFKDIGTEVRVPCVSSSIKEHTDNPDDSSDLGRAIDQSGIVNSTKDQSASSFAEGTLGTSFFTQLAANKNCCRALGVAFEQVYLTDFGTIFKWNILEITHNFHK